MFTRNIKDTFTANLLNAVSGVLGEAKKKKCSEGCECDACVSEEDQTNENYVSAAQRKAVWANRADDGKGHPDKKKMKEEVDVEEMVNEAADGLADKAKKSGVSLSVLKKVYSRGIAAWNTGHRPGTTPQQWAHARVNSYISKGKGTYGGADKDLHGEGYMPTNDMPSDKDRKTAGKLGALLKSERDAKEKKEPNGVKTEAADMPFEKPYKKVGERKDEYGNKVKNVAKYLAKKAMKANEEVEEIEENGLWANIHAKRKRIKAGSGERMRKVGEKGAPTPAGIKSAANEAFEQIDELSADTAYSYLRRKRERDYDISADGKSSKLKKPQTFAKMNKDAKSSMRALRTIEKAKKANEEAEHNNCGTPECCGQCDTPRQIDELSVKKLDQYRTRARQDIIDADDNDDNRMADKRAGGYLDASRKIYKKLAKEEAEELDEVSKATLGRYINKAKDSIDTASYRQGNKEAHGSTSNALEKKLTKRHKGIETAVKKLTKEDAEQIDELSKDTIGRYINKAKDSIDTASYRQGHKEAHGSSSKPLEKKLTKRHKGISTAVSKLTKEEEDFVDSLNNEIFEKVDPYDIAGMIKKAKAKNDPNHPAMKHVAAIEDIKKHGGALSVQGDHVRSLIKALGEESMDNDMPKGLQDRSPRGRARNAMGRAIARKERNLARVRMDRAQRGEMNKEEVELDEARGRPKKAGARDFTIHPRTKEKLMHDNPEHMARIERLQKNKVLTKPKVEANQNIIQQLQRAKLSMRGGETVNFTHGDPHHVAGTHAARLLDKHGGMKPAEKEAFQKKIGHSHANLKSEL